MNAKISVVIPTYKEVTKLQDYERALIDRVSKVFKEYTLYFILPERLLSEYKSFEKAQQSTDQLTSQIKGLNAKPRQDKVEQGSQPSQPGRTDTQ